LGLGDTLCDFDSRSQTKADRIVRWYFEVLRKYAVFGGRARRKEYWLFALPSAIITVLLLAVDSRMGTFSSVTGLGLLSGIYTVGTFIPALAVSVRRLHDTGRGGLWVLIGLIPIVGLIVLLVFMALDGQPITNQYGPNPKLRRHESRERRSSSVRFRALCCSRRFIR
jgi:uncharacterized membrane protein YhaH (DUF805 family)